MPKFLPAIIYENQKQKKEPEPIIDSENSMYTLPFIKDQEYFSSLEQYNNFIKGCERLVRNNDRYSKYIAYLKNEVKLDRCQVFKDITDEDAPIEMHHGPIFTLYDYCAIMVEYFLVKGWKITSFRIADAVLKEHELNRIQVVMLSETAHQEVHDRNIFINVQQAWGDLNAFVNKYKIAMGEEYKEKINRYIDRSRLYESNDFGIFELSKKLYS